MALFCVEFVAGMRSRARLGLLVLLFLQIIILSCNTTSWSEKLQLSTRNGYRQSIGRTPFTTKRGRNGIRTHSFLCRSSSRKDWSPETWREFPAKQQPVYDDEGAFVEALQAVKALPPMVQHWETEKLKSRLREVYEGKRFVIQGGDCAERFSDCTQSALEARIKVLEQMRIVLSSLPAIISEDNSVGMPVTVIRRAAGQYGKPRSSSHETINGEKLPAFKGENVNQLAANIESRRPDPSRLVEGALRSQCSMNYLRGRLSSGLNEYSHPETWRLDSLRPSHKESVNQILNIDFKKNEGDSEVYTSHEGLLLGLEQAMTQRIVNSEGERHYNSGAHFLWIGTRTKKIEEAHTEYFRGLDNPVGIKVGSDITPNSVVNLVKTVDTKNEPGKTVLISRFGAVNVTEDLPALAQVVHEAGLKVVWFVDPMHGNTRKTADGMKTRDFDNILREIKETHRILQLYGQHLGGIHLEITGEDVTECVGGQCGVRDEDLRKNWGSACDPRLNYEQGIELSVEVAKMLSNSNSIDVDREQTIDAQVVLDAVEQLRRSQVSLQRKA